MDELIAEINKRGWVVYMLWQDPSQWGCTLRENILGRANISHGWGQTIPDALNAALDAAPELEPEISVYKEDRLTEKPTSLLKNLLTKLGLTNEERRRA